MFLDPLASAQTAAEAPAPRRLATLDRTSLVTVTASVLLAALLTASPSSARAVVKMATLVPEGSVWADARGSRNIA
ncbi:MAG: hypothetical protein AAFY88_26575, partial [Acidobacteriota bacterium]